MIIIYLSAIETHWNINLCFKSKEFQFNDTEF